MTEEANDVTKALAAFGAPSLRYHSFGQGYIRPSAVVLPRRVIEPVPEQETPVQETPVAQAPRLEASRALPAAEPYPYAVTPAPGLVRQDEPVAADERIAESLRAEPHDPLIAPPVPPPLPAARRAEPPRLAALFPPEHGVAPPPRPLAEWAAPVVPPMNEAPMPMPPRPAPAYPESAYIEPAYPEPAYPEPAEFQTVQSWSAQEPGERSADMAPIPPPPANLPPPARPALALVMDEDITPHAPIPPPAHVAPADPAPVHPELALPEPVHPEVSHPEVSHPEVSHPELSHPEPSHPELSYLEPVQLELSHPEPAHPEPSHPEPFHPETSHPEPSHPEPSHAETSHPEPVHPAPLDPDPAALAAASPVIAGAPPQPPAAKAPRDLAALFAFLAAEPVA